MTPFELGENGRSRIKFSDTGRRACGPRPVQVVWRSAPEDPRVVTIQAQADGFEAPPQERWTWRSWLSAGCKLAGMAALAWILLQLLEVLAWIVGGGA